MILDADTWMRERLFQRLVDLLRLDTAMTPRKMWIVGGIMFTTASLHLWWLGFAIYAKTGMSPYMALLAIALMVATISQVRWYIAVQPVLSLGMIPILQRLIMILGSVDATIILVVQAGLTGRSVGVADLLFIDIGWSLVISSWYVHMCRKPPPRRPREIRADMNNRRFAVAGA